MDRYEGEAEQGDIVWFGFHSHMFESTYSGEKTVGMDIQWLALVSRTGMAGWNAVTKD